MRNFRNIHLFSEYIYLFIFRIFHRNILCPIIIKIIDFRNPSYVENNNFPLNVRFVDWFVRNNVANAFN